MLNETSNKAHERALQILESATKEGTLSEAHQARLAELAGNNVRPRVAGMLEANSPKAPTIVIAQPSEVKELVESLRLEEGYSDALETQKFFELLKEGKKVPDFGQVLKAFTPEMLTAGSGFQSPRLILRTRGLAFEDLRLAMEQHKTLPKQQGISDWLNYDGAPEALRRLYDSWYGTNSYPRRWGAYIVEAPAIVSLADFDDPDVLLDERLEFFSKHKEATKVGGVDRLKYAYILMQSLKDRKPLDHEADSFTVLDEDPILTDMKNQKHTQYAGGDNNYSDGIYGFAFWEYSSDEGKSLTENFRFRRSVGGDIPDF